MSAVILSIILRDKLDKICTLLPMKAERSESIPEVSTRYNKTNYKSGAEKYLTSVVLFVGFLVFVSRLLVITYHG